MKGISPIVATVVLILVVFVLGATVAPWMLGITYNITESTGTNTDYQTRCRNAGYDFDTGYGYSGVNWNFSTPNDEVSVKIVNTGSISLYNFSMELLINATNPYLAEYGMNATTYIGPTNPLKPGRSAILIANMTSDISGTLREIKILNDVCPTVFAKQDL